MSEKVEMAARPGDSIYNLAKKAVEMANERQEIVWFDFNGEQIHAAPGDEAQALIDAWEDRQDLARRKYRASPAYVKAQTERAQEARANQAEVNQLLLELDGALAGGLHATLLWLARFAGPADRVDVLIPHARLAAKLSRIAPAQTSVGREDLDQPGNERDAALWVIGQIVAYLEGEMPPHPMLGEFAKKYAARINP